MCLHSVMALDILRIFDDDEEAFDERLVCQMLSKMNLEKSSQEELVALSGLVSGLEIHDSVAATALKKAVKNIQALIDEDVEVDQIDQVEQQVAQLLLDEQE